MDEKYKAFVERLREHIKRVDSTRTWSYWDEEEAKYEEGRITEIDSIKDIMEEMGVWEEESEKAQ